MVTSWADLDKLAAAKPRPDGRVVLIARDDRSVDAIVEARPLSTLVAICRVLRGRFAIAERHAGRGAVVYATRGAAPSFLVDAVSAAGGAVFDGAREHTSPAPLATTVQLDAAFCDLATVVRRRLKVRTFADALDVLQHEVRRRALTPAEPSAWWSAIFELTALAGELVRSERAGRWVEAASQRLPAALQVGKEQLLPAQLAQTIVEGGAGDLRTLADVRPPVAVSSTNLRVMPVLCDRRRMPIEELTWELLVRDEVDTIDMPVIAYVEETAHGPAAAGAPTPALRARALANLAAQRFDVVIEHLPFGKVVLVTGGGHAAEAVLDRATMERVRRELGGTETVLVGVPARGHLIAIDAVASMIDDDFQRAFLLAIEAEYLRTPERDRISSEAILYVAGTGPIGRLQSNLMDARRALRRIGVDPDA